MNGFIFVSVESSILIHRRHYGWPLNRILMRFIASTSNMATEVLVIWTSHGNGWKPFLNQSRGQNPCKFIGRREIKCLHKKRKEALHCFGTSIWVPRRHVKTLPWASNLLLKPNVSFWTHARVTSSHPTFVWRQGSLTVVSAHVSRSFSGAVQVWAMAECQWWV